MQDIKDLVPLSLLIFFQKRMVSLQLHLEICCVCVMIHTITSVLINAYSVHLDLHTDMNFFLLVMF